MATAHESWNKMYNKHTFTNDAVSCVANYEEFAKTYEAVSSSLGFCLPSYVADIVQKEVPESLFHDPNAHFMDVAAGTGLIADRVREHGFTGVIDGLDGSKEMMAKAEEKGHYRKLIQHILLPDNHMPVDNASYDILTCVAALSTGHIESNLLPDMLRLVKPGGHMIFTVRDNYTAREYVAKLKEEVKRMEAEGMWSQFSMTRAEQYAVNCATNDDPTGKADHPENGPMYSLVYHFIRK